MQICIPSGPSVKSIAAHLHRSRSGCWGKPFVHIFKAPLDPLQSGGCLFSPSPPNDSFLAASCPVSGVVAMFVLDDKHNLPPNQLTAQSFISLNSNLTDLYAIVATFACIKL